MEVAADLAQATEMTQMTPGSRASGRDRTRRLWMLRLASVFLGPLLVLAALEGGLRLSHFGYPTGFFVRPDGSSVVVSNYRFGWRFFEPTMARLPEPQLVSPKAPETVRIFVLGGSAALGVPNPRFGFGRILEVMLEERHPGVRIEVVNAAMTAINSHVVLEIARDCASLQPDLFLVYMGNNEVVGPYGPGAVFQSWSPYLPLVRANLRAKSTRTGQLLANGMHVFDRDRAPKRWRGMAMAMDNPVAADDPRLDPTYEAFRRNLTDICRVGRAAGAAVVLSTVAVNLRDCPPFASQHRADLEPEEQRKWQSAYRAGAALEDGQHWQEALERYQQAAAIDDRFAELPFRMGECLTALGRQQEARERFLAARDLDVLRFRADGRINETIRAVSEEQSTDGVLLADAEGALSASAPGGVPGGESFFEHVHLTFEGNYLVARALLERVERALPRLADSGARLVPSREKCAQALVMTPWDEQQSLELMTQMTSPLPFSSQLDHAARLAALKDRARSLATSESLVESRRLYERAIEENPGDGALQHRYGQLLMALGDWEQAVAHMQVALEALPWHLQLHLDLAQAQGMNGRNKEAIALYERALEMYPIHPAAHAGLIAALAREGRRNEANAHLNRLSAIDPGFDGAHVALGNVLERQGDHLGAIAQFRKALDANPEDALAYHDLGTTLVGQDRVDEAIASFRKALEVDSSYDPARIGLGLALARRGEVEKAMDQFRAVLKTRPRDPVAAFGLGSSLASQGRLDEAIVEFRKVVEVDPWHYDAHMSLGVALASRGDVRDAITQLKQARRIDPTSPFAHYNLGIVMARHGRADEAANHFRDALQADPGHVPAYLGLGTLAAERGQIDEALMHTRRALEIDPRNDTAFFLMGQLLARRGYIEAAIACYRQALTIRPDLADARRALERLSRAQRDAGPGSAAAR